MFMCSLLLCCWKNVFAMTSAFSWQNSASLWPASFCTPRPNLSIILGIFWLLPFAFPSPVMKRTSFFGISSRRSWTDGNFSLLISSAQLPDFYFKTKLNAPHVKPGCWIPFITRVRCPLLSWLIGKYQLVFPSPPWLGESLSPPGHLPPSGAGTSARWVLCRQ